MLLYTAIQVGKKCILLEIKAFDILKLFII